MKRDTQLAIVLSIFGLSILGGACVIWKYPPSKEELVKVDPCTADSLEHELHLSRMDNETLKTQLFVYKMVDSAAKTWK